MSTPTKGEQIGVREVLKSIHIWPNSRDYLHIPIGCFNAFEVKVNKDIFKYQENIKLIS